MPVDEWDFMNEIGKWHDLRGEDAANKQAFWKIQYWMWQAKVRDGRIHDDTIKVMHKFQDFSM